MGAGISVAAMVVAAGALVAAASAPAAAPPTSRFSDEGVSFRYPSRWVVTTEPLSNDVNPLYRFAVSPTPIRRTPEDLGPCLAGVARQLSPDSVLVYLREALGADRRSSLPRMQPRPRSFRLPTRMDQSLPCFGRGGRWVPFRTGGRAFYLGVWVGRDAPAARVGAVRRLLDGLRIDAR